MSEELDQRLARLREELDALQAIKTQEDFDEGARLHAEKNAPWVKGQYSHIRFEPYTFKAFPKMLYGLDYPAAVRAREEAEMTPAFGMNDLERKQAVLLAERRVAASTTIVKSEGELRRLGSGWYETPGDVTDHLAGLQKDVEVAAAHRAYEDRKMTGKAARERDQYDEQADHFVAEIPQQKKVGPRKKVAAGVGR